MSAKDAQPESAQPSAVASALPLEEAIHSLVLDDLLGAAANPALTEELGLALLARADLRGEVLEQLSKNRSVIKGGKVRLALASHPKTPRQVSVPLIRQFYTFDLMKAALSPVVPADVKRTAEETLIARLKTITLGERLTLARQASGIIAGALLLDPEPRIMRTALENPRLTEASVVKAVLKQDAGVELIQAAAQHEKWSCRHDVQIALLRSEHLSLGRALAFSRGIAPHQLREVLQSSRLPSKIKAELLREKSQDRPKADS